MSLLFFSCSLKLQTANSSFKVPDEIRPLIGKWKETAVFISKGDRNEYLTDYSHRLQQHDQDDIMVFQNDGTFTLEEGKLKETGLDPEVYQYGKWTYHPASNELVLVDKYHDVLYKVLYLANDSLALSLPVKNSDFSTYRIFFGKVTN